MSTVLACRPMADGRYEIVSFDLDTSTVEIVQQPDEGFSLQAPKATPEGKLAWYRMPKDRNFNLHANEAVLVIDGKPLTPPATGGGWVDRITWGRHGHVAFTDTGHMIHAVERVRKPWWWFPALMPWALIQTNMDMGNPVVLGENQAEPSVSIHGLTRISTAGKGAIITPTRTFGKTDNAPGWFDPHLSPDGRSVVWLVFKQWFPTQWELNLGDLATGRVRTLVPGKDWVLQTDALWLDSSTVISSRRDTADTGFRVTATDMTGHIEILSGPEHGSLEALWVL